MNNNSSNNNRRGHCCCGVLLAAESSEPHEREKRDADRPSSPMAACCLSLSIQREFFLAA
jgi:hypothetical protein